MRTTINFHSFTRFGSTAKIGVSLAALACSLVLSSVASAQLSGTKNIPGDYATLAAAITDLNAQGVGAGGVTLNLVGGNPETAPAGGYVVGGTGSLVLTSTSMSSPVIIQGNGNTVTASAALTPGALNDGIFKLVGADWVTITGFTMLENPANTVTAAATNNMTEWGVALLYVTTTDGAQNDIIQGNTIDLDRTYQNTFGIYSNSTHTATAVTTIATATGAAGGNSGLKVYGNNITDVNLGVVVVGPTAAADNNIGIDIGGTAMATGNTLTNFGTTGTFSGYANVSATVNGILVRNSTGYNISFNNLTSSSGAGGVTAGTLRGIYVPSASNQPTGTFTNSVNNNTLAITSHVVAGTINGINVESATSTATSTTNINANNFIALNHTIAAANGSITAITQSGGSTAGPLVTSVSNNTFANITSSSTGSFTFILDSFTGPTNATKNNNNNAIVTAFNKTGAGGTVLFVSDNGSDTAGTVVNTNNNSFSNITVTGATTLTGISQTNGGAPTKNVNGNVVSNIIGGSSAIFGLTVNFDGGTTVASGNTINGITGAGAVTGISSGTSGAGTTTASQNIIHTLTGTGTGAVTGLSVAGATGSTKNISRNKIYNLENNNAAGATNGITVASGTTINMFNNLVGDLRAPAVSAANALNGINLTSSSTSSLNLSFNAVYLNATSTGANFGSSALFHTTSATATVATLNLRDNVLVNLSTPNGTGLTVAYRRSSATLTNFGAASNNNDFYAGTPGAANLIFNDGTSSDQTLAAYKARVASRDSASISENPPFLSTSGSNANFLHIDPATATQLESGGIPITGITDDFDGEIRNVTTPDIGADEFAGTLLDLAAPAISYTALGNTASTGSRMLTATITDATGVPTAGTGLPVLYWRIGAGSYSAATASSLGGGQYQFTFGSGVMVGDTVSYYVVAQDTAATPNVGANPSAGASGFTADPPAASTPPTTPNSYTIVPTIMGTKTIGGMGDYADLSAAINGPNGLNNSVITGPVTFLLLDSTYTSGPSTPDVFPIVINANAGSNATNTVTIKPAPGVTSTISGPVASGAVIKLNGASFMTIDGSNSGGTDRSLTIENTSPTTPSVVWVGSVGSTAVTDDTIKNCVIRNGVNTSSAVVISDGATLGNAGVFSNITIQNNSVQKAFIGVYATGGTVPQGGSSLVYTQNDLSTSGANAIRNVGLYMQGVNGATVSENTLGSFDPASGENDTGIWLASGTINTTVSGNNISTLGYTGTSGFSPIGINVTPGVASANNVVSENNIANLTSGGNSSTALVMGISITGASGAVTIEKNNIQNVGNTNPASWPAVGINLGGGNNNIVRNNFVARVYNDQTAGTGAFSATFGATGIRLATGTGHQVYFNSVNLYGAMAGVVSSNLVSCLAVSATTVTGCDIRDNILSNQMTGGNPTGGNTRFAGISLPSGATSALNLILNNNAYFQGLDANDRMAVVGTTVGVGDYAAADFDPSATTPAANFRSYSSTLLAANTNNDNASLASTAAVPFVSSSDLHLTTPSLVENLGTPIATVTTDIDGDPRSPTTPEIGADEIASFTLTYTAGPNGSISGTTPQTVAPGGNGTPVTAVPDTGYHFVNWSDNSTDNPRTDMNVMADISVTANFAINTYTLDYAAGANGTLTGATSQTVNYGTDGTPVTAVPNTGYHFVNWSDASTANPRTDTNVMANVNVTANFAINTYTLDYAAGANGTLTGATSQTVDYGTDGTPVTAVPNTGYHFVNWSDASTANPRTDTNVMANVNVTANFAINTYTLDYAAGPNGSLTGMTSQTVNYGTNGTAVTAVPDTGYHFMDWSDSSTANPRTDMNVMANVNVTANFAIDAPANVIVNPGAGSYATLKDAFDAINAGTHTGAVNVSIVGDTTETASAVLNASGTGSASYTSVNIFPNGSRIISGAIAAGSPLVDLNGADNVTINGLALEGNTGSLTLANSTVSATAGTSTIRFINGATSNTVTTCSVLGSSTGAVGTATGNILISTSMGGANSGNTISNNAIGPAGTNLPTKGVMSLGSASPNNNTLNVVNNNNIFDFFSPTVGVAGISFQANTTTATISNNRIFQTAARTFTGSTLTYAGITCTIGTGSGTVSVTGNTIGFGAADGTGITSLSGSTNVFVGLNLTSSSTATGSSIQGNTISGIAQSTASTGTSTSSPFRGIYLAAGRWDVGTTTGNTIGSLDGSSTITFTESATGAFIGIYDFSSSSNPISNNRLGAITINGTGTGTGGFRGIFLNTASAASATLNNNQIGASGAGAITNSLVGGYAMYAVQNSLANLTATGNTISNISGNSNLAATIVNSGMVLVGTGTAGPNTISQNVIHSLSNNSGAASNSIYALYCSFPTTTANVVERNLVHSLSMTSSVATGQLVGILPVAGTGTYKNNMVRLGLDAAGNSITTGFNIFGMFEIAGTNGIYDNSVYIGGSGVASASSTFGFVSNVTTGTRAYVDNIFWNARSNASGTGKNYAISLSGLTGAVSDYNDLFATGTGTFVGLSGGVDRTTLADWQTATGLDANSISANPQFIAPNGDALTGDLHLNCGSPATNNGTPIAGITTDFDGDTRNAMTPAIGADEPTFVAPTPVSAVSRKMHGAAGSFNIDLPLAGPVGVEPRSGGVTGDYQVVVTFATPVNVGSVTVNAGTGSVASASGNGTDTITIDLTGVTNIQYLTLSLNCADDGVNLGDVSVTMGLLIGDTNGDGSVGGSDVAQTKAAAGQSVDGTNFFIDVVANGAINAADVGTVKLHSGEMLPPSAPASAIGKR